MCLGVLIVWVCKLFQGNCFVKCVIEIVLFDVQVWCLGVLLFELFGGWWIDVVDVVWMFVSGDI